MQTKTVHIQIEGMSCGHCANFIHRTLDELDGIVEKEVSLENAQASVQYDDSKITASAIVKAIDETHFKVAGIQ